MALLKRLASAILFFALVLPMPAVAGVDEGDALPAVTLPDWQGRPYTLGHSGARVVVVEFWASWCAPCREALPAMAELARAHPDVVEVVAINIDRTTEPADEFVATHLPALPAGVVLVRDPEGSALSKFGASGMPSLFVASGGVVRLAQGGFSAEKRAEAERLIRELASIASAAFDRSATRSVTLVGAGP